MEDSSYTPPRGNVAKYQLLMELGKGGMGVVHLAMSRGPQGFTKLLVLKIMRRELLGEQELLQMFLEEARISARLAHPNIVHVFEVGEHEGCPCIVMEYLEGQPLSSMLVRAPEKPPLPLHLCVLAKALAGLHAAHELRDYDGTSLRLVHRDVSPHNVFVLFDGQVKVLDFGIAKAAGSEVETRTGTPKGKIRYMSPEQLIRDPLDRRADIFSVGVLMWEALARRRMWSEMEEGDVTRALLNRKIPALPLSDTIPAELREMCMRALAPDPVDRYATAEAFQRDIERYLTALPEPCGADELGAFLRTQFGELRQATKKLIDFHIKAALPGPGLPGNTPTGSSRDRRPTSPGRTAPGGFAAVELPAPIPLPMPLDAVTGEALTRAYPPPAAAALDPASITMTLTPAGAPTLESAGRRRRDRRRAGILAGRRELAARGRDPRRGQAGDGASRRIAGSDGTAARDLVRLRLQAVRRRVRVDRPPRLRLRRRQLSVVPRAERDRPLQSAPPVRQRDLLPVVRRLRRR